MPRGSAIGLIETSGVIAMVVAADVALKTSEVRLLGYQNVRSGMVTVIISGNVDAVAIAVEAAVRKARSIGNVYNFAVLTRAENETWDMLEQQSSRVKGIWTQADAIPIHSSPLDVTKVSEVTGVTSVQRWEAFNVEQLRRMVRKLPQTELTGRQISKANRQMLIDLLLRYLKEVERNDND